MERRRFLSAAGAAGTLAFAGCIGDDTSSDGGGPGGRSIEDHPAAAGLTDQPRRGDRGGHVVLAFEDPSCSRCRAFERNTVPEIESRLVQPGKAAFVFRGYPVVYPWGDPASHALEATFDRSEDAFWSLLDHYFADQSGFSTDNVLDRTEQFLADETDVDGTSVVQDVQNGATDDAVQADLDAGRNADLGGITPVVVLFKNGTYVTTATGSVSYEVIATALGESSS